MFSLVEVGGALEQVGVAPAGHLHGTKSIKATELFVCISMPDTHCQEASLFGSHLGSHNVHNAPAAATN